MVIYHNYTTLPHGPVRGFTHSQLVWYCPLWYDVTSQLVFFFFLMCKVRYFWDHTCPTYPFTTHHSSHTTTSSLGLPSVRIFFSLIHSSLLLYLLSLVLPHHHHRHFHHHSPAKSPENYWEPINTFTSFFGGKNF